MLVFVQAEALLSMEWMLPIFVSDVGEEYRRRKEVLNTCPLQQARWCVISRQEMEKCENMIMAFAAKGESCAESVKDWMQTRTGHFTHCCEVCDAGLKPDLNCIRGWSTRDCMDKIRLGDADMIALDAADVYVGGK